MKSYNTAAFNKAYWPIILLLASGVLTGCNYCEPLLMTGLLSGAVYKLLSTTTSGNSEHRQLHN